MPAQVEAPDMPPGLQHKSAAATEPIVTTNDDTGEVTAVVSVTNVVDEVGDVILPGAYTDTLIKRRPKGVWSHSWKDWVARTEEIREYPPGDPQLKALLAEAGASLPADAGALVVRCKFNMQDPDSYKAFQKVKFFSETNECQWSIGYSVPPGKGVRDAKGIRKIHGLDLFEYSPVLFGAASQSTSLSVKSVDPAQWPDEHTETVTAVPEDETGAVPLQPVDDQIAGDGAVPEDTVLADNDPLPDLNQPVADDALDAVESIAREAAGDDPTAAPDGPVEEVKRKFTAADRGKAADKGQAQSDGSFPIENEKDLRNAIQAVGRAKDPAAAKAHIVRRAQALGLTDLLPDGWMTEKKSDDPADVLSEFEARLAAIEAKYDTSSVGTPGGRQNWVDKAGGLPAFVRAVAHALIRAGHSKQQAIQLAVGTIRRWASGGGDVTDKTRAKAAAAIAEWDAKRGGKDAEPAAGDTADGTEVETPAGEPVVAEAASGEPEGLLTKWVPAAEVGRFAAHRVTPDADDRYRVQVEAKDFPQIAGTQEETREMLRVALVDLLAGAGTKDAATDAPWVNIDGTFPDEVIATVHAPDGATESWRVPYSIDRSEDGASVSLGAARPARLTVAADDAAQTDDAGPDVPLVLLDGVGAAMIGAKLLIGSPEFKAGRVLSGSNAERIAAAVESLIAVLGSAGVQIEVPDQPSAQVDQPAEDMPVEAKSLSFTEDVELNELYAAAAELRVLSLRA